MPTHSAFIAQIVKPDLPALPEAAPAPKAWGDRSATILLASLLAVAFVIFFWASFLRKRPRKGKGTLIADHDHSSDSYGSSGRKRRRKRRENHPDNWGRNPTLSETGGLPPARADDSEPPASPQAPKPG
jgi:hypothetical protein